MSAAPSAPEAPSAPGGNAPQSSAPGSPSGGNTPQVAPPVQATSVSAPPALPAPTQAGQAAPQNTPASSSGTPDTTPPTLSNVQNTPKGYYQPGCGATSIVISADATDDSGAVTQVWANYQFVSLEAAGLGSTQWYQVVLSPAGGGHYEGTIDLTAQAPGDLRGHDGTLQYQVYAQDAAGNIRVEPDGYVYGAEALACGQNPPASSAERLSISNITLYPQPEVYYGACGTEETMLNIQATIEPMDKISLAEIRYGYRGPDGFQGGYTVSMFQLGIGDYAGDINVGQEAEAVLNGAAGQIEFSIHAKTQDGQVLESDWFSFPVQVCGGVLGEPPTLQEPDILYFRGPDSAAPGDTIMLEWEVQNACKVFLNGNEVSPDGPFLETIPANEGNTTYAYTLAAWGNPCDNSTEKTATWTVQIQAPGGNNPGGGNSVVRFYNNASHPVVELLIDGSDVILDESQSIPVGGYLDVSVSPGSHTYQPGVGFWQGGSKASIYPLPAGSFDSQSGSVTLNDPSLGEMLTNYGQSGYYAGTFWDDNVLVHCAAFDFDANGGFDFYVDGTYDESGTYTLLSRDPGTYSVSFRVSGSTSGEQFEGTFYYTGAAAGTIQMPNGPSSWTWIEYVLNGSCP